MAVMRSGALAALVLLAIAGTGGVAQAAKPKPLPLHARVLGVSPNGARAFDARYAVVRWANSVDVIDDLTGRRYSQGLPRGCVVMGLRVPEALLGCLGEVRPYVGRQPDRPLILDLRDGRQIALPRGEPPGKPSPRGYRPGIDYAFNRLGSQWIQGRYGTAERVGTVYLNRFTGERREVWPPRRLDLDSPGLSPDNRPEACSGPGRPDLLPRTRRWLTSDRRRGLILRRCGRRARLISRCPDHCRNRALTKRFVVWTGKHSVVIHSIRTRRRFKLRFPGHTKDRLIGIAATDRRVRISLARERDRKTFRILELRLPRFLR